MGTAGGMVNNHIGAWIMQRIDVAVRGRVASVLMLASFGISPISLAVAGFFVAWSLKLMFLLAGGLMVLAAVVLAARFQPWAGAYRLRLAIRCVTLNKTLRSSGCIWARALRSAKR